MRKGSAYAVAASVLCILAAAGAACSFTAAETLVTSYLAHEPIVISGDAELTDENGVTGGSGTPEDPFLIEGWKIDISGSTYQSPTGIHIQHTSASLVIRDIMVHSGSLDSYEDSSTGILLYGVENCVIENTRTLNNTEGIYLIDSAYITVEGCDSRDNAGNGVTAERSTDLSISNNTFAQNAHSGIALHDCADSLIYGNSATDNDGFGIDVRGSEDIEVCNNMVSRNLIGVNVGYSSDVAVTDNLISENRQAIVVYASEDIVYEPNTLLDNEIDLSGQEEGGLPIIGVVAAVAAVVGMVAVVLVWRRRAG